MSAFCGGFKFVGEHGFGGLTDAIPDNIEVNESNKRTGAGADLRFPRSVQSNLIGMAIGTSFKQTSCSILG